MIDKPEIVREVHGLYFESGATIATTNTYALHRDRLEQYGLADRLPELVGIALNEAETARATFGSGRIAGSLGPMGASYRPDICPPPQLAEAAYAEIVRIMDKRVDLFLIETASSVSQAEGALRGAAHGTKPVWLGVSVMDDDGRRLRSGEQIADLAGLIEAHRPQAVLVNCSRPEVVADGLEIIKGFGQPFGAYANGFTRITEAFLEDSPTVDALQARNDLDPVAYAAFAMAWVEQGATIVGGCCEVGPTHIAELARQLSAAGYDIV